jgi:MFS family permease
MVGKAMNKKGKKRFFITLGFIVMGVGNLFFLIIPISKDIYVFLILGSIARIILGIGQGMFMAPAFSIVPLVYKKTFENKIGIMEALSGMGLSLGPVFGGLFFSLAVKITGGNEDVGFCIPFIFCSLLSFLAVPLALKYIPYKP